MPTAPCLIFAVGNESRGDDALGPLLLRAIDQRLASGALPNRYELLEDFQLQVEHALDMREREAVLFIDAGHDTQEPYRFYRAQAQALGHSTHALAPEALLTVYRQVESDPPPPSYVLCVCGKSFELGEDLSVPGQNHFGAALDFVERLLLRDCCDWDGFVQTTA